MIYFKIFDLNVEDVELFFFFLRFILLFCFVRWLLVVVVFRDMDVAIDIGIFFILDIFFFFLRFFLFFLDFVELIVEVLVMRLLFLFFLDLLYVGLLADGNNVFEIINRMLYEKRFIYMYIE